MGSSFEIQLTYHGDLTGFLPSRMRGKLPIVRQLREKTAVKDVIEACGVPHPEIDLIVVTPPDAGDSFSVDFQWQAVGPSRIDAYGFPAPSDVLPSAPRLQTPHFDRFVTDGHLGKLARNLRLLGLDTAYAREADDRLLLEVMALENRALLTRDRRLLMHSVVRHGFCPRSTDPEEQTQEVLRRFGLLGSPGALAPFSRCLECNGLLQSIPKADVLERLAGEPLTLRYYDDYRMCSTCGRIYWAGTHFSKLVSRVSKFIGH
ncbi:MAG: Mut7-C RNAse domain-containing protein [Terrimicrobiaceae bacterium]